MTKQKTIFDQIKKQNGEEFAKAIRSYDNGIFDIPNIVNIVKYAGRQAEPILQYLLSLKNIQIEEHGVYQDPISLLDKAGYDAYYVTTPEEEKLIELAKKTDKTKYIKLLAETLRRQNTIQKYYATAKDVKRLNIDNSSPNGELICTITDESPRFEKYYIINAVRKDVDKIKREDFVGKEQREDIYGTSVISIQILKTGGFISIKNRYNHTVDNCDNTLNSNPDNIIPGLSESLKRYFKVDFSAKKPNLTDGFAIINNQIIHYHQIIHYELETDNIYFGSTFYVKNGVIYPLNKDTEIMLDTCILNVKNRTIYDPNSTLPVLSIDEPCQSYNALVTILANEFKNKKIKIEKNKETGGHNVFADSIKIASEHDGKITELNLPTTEKIGEYFLFRNKDLESFNAPKLTQVGRCFLYSNTKLKNLNTPKLTIVGYGFLNENEELTSLNLPSLKEAGSCFLCKNTKLKSLYLPNLEYFENILSDRIELEAWIVSKTVKECFLSDVLSMQNPPQIKLNSSSSAQKDNKNSFDLKKTQLQRKRNNQR